MNNSDIARHVLEGYSHTKLKVSPQTDFIPFSANVYVRYNVVVNSSVVCL